MSNSNVPEMSSNLNKSYSNSRRSAADSVTSLSSVDSLSTSHDIPSIPSTADSQELDDTGGKTEKWERTVQDAQTLSPAAKHVQRPTSLLTPVSTGNENSITPRRSSTPSSVRRQNLLTPPQKFGSFSGMDTKNAVLTSVASAANLTITPIVSKVNVAGNNSAPNLSVMYNATANGNLSPVTTITTKDHFLDRKSSSHESDIQSDSTGGPVERSPSNRRSLSPGISTSRKSNSSGLSGSSENDAGEEILVPQIREMEGTPERETAYHKVGTQEQKPSLRNVTDLLESPPSEGRQDAPNRYSSSSDATSLSLSHHSEADQEKAKDILHTEHPTTLPTATEGGLRAAADVASVPAIWAATTPTNTTNNNKGKVMTISSSEKKKKTGTWYSLFQPSPSTPRRYKVLNPTYKSRSEDFKKIFKDIPNDERLIVDYSCAMQKDILVHGRIYITQNWVCFYANIFRWETVLMIKCKDIASMTKEKTARVIPNAKKKKVPTATLR